MRRVYRSWIPKEAEERIVETHPDGTRKVAEYTMAGEVVGARHFDEDGMLVWEIPLKGDQRHGTVYTWSEGKISSEEPYRDGLAHGTARQWTADGRLIGTYMMRRGTGSDLWWSDWEDDTATLSEVHPNLSGDPHGYEWWFDGTGEAVLWQEYHWRLGLRHGIEREWNNAKRLHRGYPKYWVSGEQVNRARYLRAAARDPTLPPVRPEEDQPYRELPPEIASVLRVKLPPKEPARKARQKEQPDSRGN